MNAPVLTSSITPNSAYIEVDPRLAFLVRASARLIMVSVGHMEIGEAFDGLIEPFEEILGYYVCDSCGAAPCVSPSLCATCRGIEAGTNSRRRPAHPRSRTTPDSLVEAIKYSLSKRGLSALKEPVTLERLGRCDHSARTCINEWIAARLSGATI